jgi:hypothetical protein
MFMRHRAKFPDASLHYDINVKLFDNRDRDWHLLGEASLPASAIPGTDPVFLWLPLQPPKQSGLPFIKVRSITPRCIWCQAAPGPCVVLVHSVF